MQSGNANLAAAIKERAEQEGFAACGIAPSSLSLQTGNRFRQWLADGLHGDMIWMEGRADQRSSPDILWPDVKSVIVLGMNYAPVNDPFMLEDKPDLGRISVYAQSVDYHDVVKKALKRIARWLVDEAGCELKVFVDTAPVMEKPLAMAAGIGWQGKHTCVVSRENGNWLFLGAIYTTLELEAEEPSKDRCGSCTACQDICPTNAFPKPYELDARACISYLTIENKGPIARKYREAIGNHIYGCDDCLAICPWNKFAKTGQAHKAFRPRAELVAPDIASLLALDDQEFRQVFAGTPVKRTGRDRMVRNSLIAAGNSGNAALIEPVLTLLNDENASVRGAAIWALSRLDESAFLRAKSELQNDELDDAVRAEWDGACPVELGLVPA